MLDFFRRGRGLTLLGALAALLASTAIVVEPTVMKNLLFIGALGVLFFFLSMWVSSQKKLEGYAREILRRVSSLEQANEELRAGQKKYEREVQQRSLDELVAPESASVDRVADAKQGLLFAPQTITASAILDRPSAQQAGRLAAMQTMDSDAFEVLRALEGATDESRQRRIEIIGSDLLAKSLGDLGIVQRIEVPHQLGACNSGTSYLIVDERELESGAWAGTLTSQSTSRFLSLSEHIRKAQALGVVVVIVKAPQQDHFSNELRQMATVLIEGTEPNWEWEDDVYFPVLKVLTSVLRGEEG